MPAVIPTGRIRFHFDNLHFDDPLNLGPYRVMQVGDLASDGDFKCPSHIQQVHEITYIVNGSAVFVCDGKRIPVEKGMVVVNTRGSLHEILPVEHAPLRYYYIGLEISDTSAPEDKILKHFLDTCRRNTASADRSVAGAFQDIFCNMLNQDSFSTQLMRDAVRKLLVWTKRSFDGGGRHVYLPEIQSGKSRFLSEVCSYLDSSVEDMGALKRLPAQFGYSYSYLSGMFSKAMGLSLRQYFLMRRHEHECTLLKQGYSVTAVAEKMGYGSVHSFSHAFAARNGAAPSLYTTQRLETKK
ncbi:MAG: AraC family transcriptional regulator [Eubacteriales bacterium]|nr:AraC family transcriptional regulator [Eubacteriales bacterium]